MARLRRVQAPGSNQGRNASTEYRHSLEVCPAPGSIGGYIYQGQASFTLTKNPGLKYILSYQNLQPDSANLQPKWWIGGRGIQPNQILIIGAYPGILWELDADLTTQPLCFVIPASFHFRLDAEECP